MRSDESDLGDVLSRNLAKFRVFARAHMTLSMRRLESSSDLVQSVCREVLADLDRRGVVSERVVRQYWFRAARDKLVQRLRYLNAECRDMARAAPMSDSAYNRLCVSLATSSRVAASREQIERLEAVLAASDPEHRDTFMRRFIFGYKNTEIAAQLDIPVSTVNSRIHRVRSKLAKALAG